MRKIALLAMAGALAVPGGAIADGATGGPNPAKSCKEQRAAMGIAAFKALYGTNATRSNAFGKCVAKQARTQGAAERSATANAPATCRAERDADPAAFADKYGTGKGKHDAFGRCVSQTAKATAEQTIADHDQATIDAAKACKAERAADPTAFKDKYGTNRTKRNAFGKCVSQQVRAGQG